MRKYKEVQFTLKLKGGYAAKSHVNAPSPTKDDFKQQEYKSLTVKFVPTKIRLAGPVGHALSGDLEVRKMIVTLEREGNWKPIVLDASDKKLQMVFKEYEGSVYMLWQHDENHIIAMNATCVNLKHYKKKIKKIFANDVILSMDKPDRQQLLLWKEPPKKQTKPLPTAGNERPEEEQKEEIEVNSGATSTSEATTPELETLPEDNGEAGNDSETDSIPDVQLPDWNQWGGPKNLAPQMGAINIPPPGAVVRSAKNLDQDAKSDSPDVGVPLPEITSELPTKSPLMIELKEALQARQGNPPTTRRLAESNGLENAFSMLLMLPLLLLLIFVFKRFSQSGLKNDAENNEECEAEVDEHIV